MNEIVKYFLFMGDKFIPGMHLRQSRFTYECLRIMDFGIVLCNKVFNIAKNPKYDENRTCFNGLSTLL